MLTKRGEILDNLSAAALIDTYVRLNSYFLEAFSSRFVSFPLI